MKLPELVLKFFVQWAKILVAPLPLQLSPQLTSSVSAKGVAVSLFTCLFENEAASVLCGLLASSHAFLKMRQLVYCVAC